jgi:hypothetical protein
VISLKLIHAGCKNFIFIPYSPVSVGLQNIFEIKNGHIICCVDLAWNE